MLVDVIHCEVRTFDQTTGAAGSAAQADFELPRWPRPSDRRLGAPAVTASNAALWTDDAAAKTGAALKLRILHAVAPGAPGTQKAVAYSCLALAGSGPKGKYDMACPSEDHPLDGQNPAWHPVTWLDVPGAGSVPAFDASGLSHVEQTYDQIGLKIDGACRYVRTRSVGP